MNVSRLFMFETTIILMWTKVANMDDVHIAHFMMTVADSTVSFLFQATVLPSYTTFYKLPLIFRKKVAFFRNNIFRYFMAALKC